METHAEEHRKLIEEEKYKVMLKDFLEGEDLSEGRGVWM